MKHILVNNQKHLEQRVHRKYLLREAEHFVEHKKGLPEWIKNSDDSMIRHEEEFKADFKGIPILINYSKDKVICLDFGGADGEIIKDKLPHYGDPNASTHGDKIKSSVSGGHGNGGKYYGLAQFENTYALSFFNGKTTILELNKEGDNILTDSSGKDIVNSNVPIEEVINFVGFDKWSYFKMINPLLFEKIKTGKINFFCWIGNKPKDKITDKRKYNKLLEQISYNLQSRQALIRRDVCFLLRGDLFFKNLKPIQIELDEENKPLVYKLPEKIGDYHLNPNLEYELEIFFSKEKLVGEKNSLNILEINADYSNIAYYHIPELLMEKELSKFIGAKVNCPLLKEENCTTNDRVYLKDNELSSLFLGWCREKLNSAIETLKENEKKEKEVKDLDELSSFFNEVLDEVSDLLEIDSISNQEFDKNSNKTSGDKKVSGPSDKVEGFGNKDNNINSKGGGKRQGEEEQQNQPIKDKKSKGQIKILISGHSQDPLNPGNVYELLPRQEILVQRPEDVDHGIWWLNSSKEYVKKFKIKDDISLPFYFFIIKEVVVSQHIRRLEKDPDNFNVDFIEHLNFDFIDNIFERLINKYSFDSENQSKRIREYLISHEEFTIKDIFEELNIEPQLVHSYFNINKKDIELMFKVEKRSIDGNSRNYYIKKIK